jgi:hypothetical protein
MVRFTVRVIIQPQSTAQLPFFIKPTFHAPCLSHTNTQYNKDGLTVTDGSQSLNVHTTGHIMCTVRNEHSLANNPH